MDPKDFLFSELETIAQNFPYVQIRYAFDPLINTHLVEFTPLFEYNNNRDLDDAWIPLSLKFMQEYKFEEIAFISSDSSLYFDKADFILNEHVCTSDPVVGLIYGDFTNIKLNYSFPIELPAGKIMPVSMPCIYIGHVQPIEDSPDLSNLYSFAA